VLLRFQLKILTVRFVVVSRKPAAARMSGQAVIKRKSSKVEASNLSGESAAAIP